MSRCWLACGLTLRPHSSIQTIDVLVARRHVFTRITLHSRQDEPAISVNNPCIVTPMPINILRSNHAKM